ncbi:MAG: PAS domain S-box protein [Candidatus Methanosuratincola petrocarbonis]
MAGESVWLKRASGNSHESPGTGDVDLPVLGYLARVIDLVKAVVCIVDHEGKLIWINKYGLDLFGFSEEEMLGRSVYDTIVPKRESTGRDLTRLFERVAEGDEVSYSINENMRKDGSRIWVNWSNAVIREPGKPPVVLSTGIDITNLVDSELRHQRLKERDRALVRILSLLISPETGVDEISAAILDAAMNLTNSDYGLIGFIDPETKELVGHTFAYPQGSLEPADAARNEHEPPPQGMGNARRIAFAPGCAVQQSGPGGDKGSASSKISLGSEGRYRGLFGHALNNGVSFYTNSPRDHPAYSGTPPGHVPIERFLAVPVISGPGKESLGIIALANPRRSTTMPPILETVSAASGFEGAGSGGSGVALRDYDSDDLETVSSLAYYFALALQRKELFERTARSEAYYKSLFENSPLPLVYIRKDRIIAQVNDAFESVFGYAAEEVEGKLTWESFVHPSDLPRLREYRKARFSGEKGVPTRYDVVLLRKDGSPIDCQLSIVIQEGGDIIAAIADLTEIKRVTRELEESKRELERYSKHLEGLVQEKTQELLEKERLAAVGEVSLMVGHDLRNPLQAILNLSFEISEFTRDACDCAPPEKVSALLDIVQRIERNVRYMDKIVSDLHFYGVPIKPNYELVSLKEVLDSALLGVEIPDEVHLRIAVGSSLLFDADSGLSGRAMPVPSAGDVSADRSGDYGVADAKVMLPTQQLSRALKNLIINAIQAMQGKGTLAVSAWLEPARGDGAAAPEAPAPAAGSGQAPGGAGTGGIGTVTAVFSVSDTGPGIDPEILKNLFKPFKTTKAKGTGLGLAIVKRIVDALGGTIEVESELGKGTRFTIRVPASLPPNTKSGS